MVHTLALIGFGEAARAFVSDGLPARSAYDNDVTKRDGIANFDCLYAALSGANLILSVVTADQSLSVASFAAQHVTAGTLYCDMNSVAPDTKRAAAQAIEAAGGRYIDVAIMAPVHPQQLAVPLLVSGPNADDGVAALRTAGFSDVRVIAGGVGQASAIKMIRSVMVKGIEALTAEMMLGARAAGVEDDVLKSLGEGWAVKAAYNLERMTTHGIRRASEMEQVAATLTALGVEPVMTRGTIIRQREMAA